MNALRTDRRHAEGGFTLVELLVAITITSIIAASVTSVVISSFRVDQNQISLQQVIGDGRISLQRIRGELRSARRVHEDSGPSAMRFWVDGDQDQVPTDEEQICYLVQPIGTTGNQWQIVRFTGASDPGSCAFGTPPPSGVPVQVVARTLIDPAPFVAYTPVPGGPADPATREVDIRLVLEVVGARNINQTTVEGSIRLRNVP